MTRIDSYHQQLINTTSHEKNHNSTNDVKEKNSLVDTLQESFSKSDTLQLIEQQKANKTLFSQQERLDTLRKKIADGTFPILSDDNEVLAAASQRISDKLSDFEQQLASLDRE